MFKEVLETLAKFGYTILLFFKSTLLKTIPKFGSAGLIVMLTLCPLCNATPLKDTFFFIVF